MEYLNLQQLRRCCRPDAIEMDETEVGIVHEILLQYLIIDLNVRRIAKSLFEGGYISEEVFRNIQRVIVKEFNQNVLTVTKKIIKYLTNKISFVALLWALSACGHDRVANLMLSKLENARCGTVSPQVQKAPIIRSRAMYVLVKQLKYLSDSKTIENPVQFIRRLAMRFKEKFTSETEPCSKWKMANKYFAVLAVELDNCTFMKNKYVSAKSLAAEIWRILPFTSNPAMNEALINGRVAEDIAQNGNVSTAMSMIQDVVMVMLNTETCPESANLYYIQLNVWLQNYERSPSLEMKNLYIEMGHNGLRLLGVLDEDMMAYWKVSYMLKIIFCALDISITGLPVCFKQDSDKVETAQYFLSEVGNVINMYGIRKRMSYKLAMGRMFHIQGSVERAIVYLKEAKELAQRGNFLELKSIDEYEKSLCL